MSKFSEYFNSLFSGKSVEEIAQAAGTDAETIASHAAGTTEALGAQEAHSLASALVAFEHIVVEDVAKVAKTFIGLFHDDQVEKIDQLTQDADNGVDKIAAAAETLKQEASGDDAGLPQATGVTTGADGTTTVQVDDPSAAQGAEQGDAPAQARGQTTSVQHVDELGYTEAAPTQSTSDDDAASAAPASTTNEPGVAPAEANPGTTINPVVKEETDSENAAKPADVPSAAAQAEAAIAQGLQQDEALGTGKPPVDAHS